VASSYILDFQSIVTYIYEVLETFHDRCMGLALGQTCQSLEYMFHLHNRLLREIFKCPGYGMQNTYVSWKHYFL